MQFVAPELTHAITESWQKGQYTWNSFCRAIQAQPELLPIVSFTDPLRALLDPALLPEEYLKVSRHFVSRLALDALQRDDLPLLLDCSILPGSLFLIRAAEILQDKPTRQIRVPYSHLASSHHMAGSVLAHICLYARLSKQERLADSAERESLLSALRVFDPAILIAMAIASPASAGVLCEASGLIELAAWVSAIHRLNGNRASNIRNLYERCRVDPYAMLNDQDELSAPPPGPTWMQAILPRSFRPVIDLAAARFSEVPAILEFALSRESRGTVQSKNAQTYVGTIVTSARACGQRGLSHPALLSQFDGAPCEPSPATTFSLLVGERVWSASDAVALSQRLFRGLSLAWKTASGELLFSRGKIFKTLSGQPREAESAFQLASWRILSDSPELSAAKRLGKQIPFALDQIYSGCVGELPNLWYQLPDGDWSLKLNLMPHSLEWLSEIGFSINENTADWIDPWCQFRCKLQWYETEYEDFQVLGTFYQTDDRMHWQEIAPDPTVRWISELTRHLVAGFELISDSNETAAIAELRRSALLGYWPELSIELTKSSRDEWVVANSVRRLIINFKKLSARIDPEPRTPAQGSALATPTAKSGGAMNGIFNTVAQFMAHRQTLSQSGG